jgi:hypothetical protein
MITYGPGKLSLVEDYRTNGDLGPQLALGIFWWDQSEHGYKVMFCGNKDPDGCSVYKGLGQWEGQSLMFWFERGNGGKPLIIKQSISATSSTSFTATFYSGESRSSLQRYRTVVHTRENDSP